MTTLHSKYEITEKINHLIGSAIHKDQQGRPDLAERDLRQALSLNNKHPDVLNLLSILCQRSNRSDEAIKLSKKAVKFAPKSAPIHFNYGNLLASKGDYESARSEFIKATSLDSKFAPAFKNLGSTLAFLRQFSAAIDAFTKYLKLNPDDQEAQINLSTANLQLGNNLLAVKDLKKLYEESSSPSFELVHNYALASLSTSDTSKAEKLFRQAIDLSPEDYDGWLGLAQCLADRNLARESQSAYVQAKKLGASSTFCDYKIADALLENGFYDEAMQIYNKLCHSQPNSIAVLSAAAMADSRMGDFNAQESKLRHILSLQPNNMPAFSNLASIPGRKFLDKDLNRLIKLVSNKDFDLDARRRAAFALGDIYHNKRDYDKAFQYFKTGNDLKGYVFDRNKYTDFIDELIETFSATFFHERTDWGSNEKSQILIVGTPRSGTTLTEQILAAHPDVASAGERGTIPSLSLENLENKSRIQTHPSLITSFDKISIQSLANSYIDNLSKAIANQERHVTNKLPGNFQWVGLFFLLFPNGRIIHTRRDPRDSLLSIYFKDFGGMHDYAYKLDDLGFWYREYERLMSHWKNLFGNRILDIDYEYIVKNQKDASAMLLKHIDLPWNDKVLEYYNKKSLVKTASIWQVRQPIYNTSVNRWKNYEKHLEPLFDQLQLSTK